MSRLAAELGGVRASPNIWNDPGTYELENLAFDREQVVEEHLEGLHPISGATLVDIGCGSGFHLPRFAARGARVIGVEPHPPLARLARERVAGLVAPGHAAVLLAPAAALPLADNSIDIVHARWAYFFGPGSEPGLAEVTRVLRPGGLALFLDNNASRSTFGSWFQSAHPAYDPVAVERFWRRQGFSRIDLNLAWECSTRADFEAIVGIEFEPAAAARILASHPGTSVDYAVTLWHRRF